ncbi:putative RING-H2 finger protein ATL21A [Chenopodium quinoa]|uniref:putative RING-H2 finger protein ATL21A n=1 Tax=Chenopodium quinoa TaxID=63459 RepID=UPI000B7947C1|nr:putative RING-H2 finger protein ATL21A [Chenopodium quinoa]
MIFFKIPNKFLLILVPILFSSYAIAQKCDDYQCDSSILGTRIRFPFREVDHQPKSCGHPGFDVRCKGTNITLELPNSIVFKIDRISYDDQYIDLIDTDGCLPLKILSLDLSNTSFYSLYYQEFAIFNCSGYFDDMHFNNTISNELRKIDCLSGLSYTVYAINPLWAVSLLSSTCQWVSNVSVPDFYGVDFSAIYEDDFSFTLHWDEPQCGPCEKIDRRCRVRGDTTHGIECTTKLPGLFPSYNNGNSSIKAVVLALAIGLPLFLVVLFVSMVCIRRRMQRNNESATDSTMRRRNHTTIAISQSTLDSFPTVVINESGQLATADDHNCPICFLEYKIKDVLKILPHCLHRFHVACIDQWLLLDGTCPICRVAPI